MDIKLDYFSHYFIQDQNDTNFSKKKNYAINILIN